MENVLVEKWNDLIVTDKAAPVTNKEAIAQLLENEEQYIVSEATQTGDMAQYTPILVPAVRRIFPQLLANEIVGVQPMNAPTGYAYALRYAYDGASQSGAAPSQANVYGNNHRGQFGGAAGRAGDPQAVNQVFTSAVAILTGGTIAASAAGLPATISGGGTGTISFVSADGTTVVIKDANAAAISGIVAKTATINGLAIAFGSNNEAGFNAILPNFTGPVTTDVGERMGDTSPFPNMKMSLERVAIEVMTRKLKAEYSIELAQDLKAVHGLDAEAELINILEYEITAEIDRELVWRINNAATVTQGWAYKGYNVSGGAEGTSDGRWEAERFRTLYTRITKEANQVALTTRRGTANFIIASSNVVTALESLSNFMYSAVPGDVKPTLGVAKVGTLDGRFAVYLDTFAALDYVTVGYKGASQFDTGVIYCPYVPLMLQKVTDPNTFQPKIAFLTRDAIAENMFGSAAYYRTFQVNFDGSSLSNSGTAGAYAYTGKGFGLGY